jgi:hypothetical protein
LKKWIGFIAVVWFVWPVMLFADLRIVTVADDETQVDSTMGVFVARKIHLEKTLWLNLEKRCAQVDTKLGSKDEGSSLIFADSLLVQYRKFQQFEVYTRTVEPPSQPAPEEFSGGLGILSEVTFTVDTTDSQQIICSFLCQQIISTRIEAEDTLTHTVWVTDEICLPAWVSNLLDVGLKHRTKGLPLRTIYISKHQYILQEVISVTEDVPPPDTYVIPVHYSDFTQ